MNQDPMKPIEPDNNLASVFNGMEVYDRDGEKVGQVDYVYMGTSHEHGEGASQPPQGSVPVTGPLITPFPESRRSSGAEALGAGFFTADQVPDEVQRRLANEGFIRVDSNRLFASDRYILPSQIENVSGDRVVLNVPYRDLIKKPM